MMTTTCEAIRDLLTVQDVADHFGISNRRAQSLIKNRHRRLGVGARLGHQWLVHRDELEQLQPDERYQRKGRE